MKDWQFGLLFGSLLAIQGRLTLGAFSLAFSAISIVVFVAALVCLVRDD